MDSRSKKRQILFWGGRGVDVQNGPESATDGTCGLHKRGRQMHLDAHFPTNPSAAFRTASSFSDPPVGHNFGDPGVAAALRRPHGS